MRRLSAHEQALWSRVAASVRPLKRAAAPPPAAPAPPVAAPRALPKSPEIPPPRPLIAPRNAPSVTARTLDGGWDRKLRGGDIRPDRVVDLHGHTLAAAHAVLAAALDNAMAAGDRVILVITGKGRPDRPSRIRHELAHWLDHGSQRSRIAALRPAHPRHGGGGAFYLILRRN
ncbi:MAG: DNA mismatch repair protein MutS [Alphaproteobacteria bacterium PA4]|nr:MAG: DNA mismatch repair protein MutS [Alphaproteobacteria bacterium PA4]